MVSISQNSPDLSSYGHFCTRFGPFSSPAPNAQFLFNFDGDLPFRLGTTSSRLTLMSKFRFSTSPDCPSSSPSFFRVTPEVFPGACRRRFFRPPLCGLGALSSKILGTTYLFCPETCRRRYNFLGTFQTSERGDVMIYHDDIMWMRHSLVVDFN